jgi:hypothetical protein
VVNLKERRAHQTVSRFNSKIMCFAILYMLSDWSFNKNGDARNTSLVVSFQGSPKHTWHTLALCLWPLLLFGLSHPRIIVLYN